jgi:hypothetical protein
MPTVERTQISLDAAQAARLRRLARERGTSMAALIRDAVERTYPDSEADSREARWARAMAAVGSVRSDTDGGVSSRVDDEFADSIEEHHRLRRRTL